MTRDQSVTVTTVVRTDPAAAFALFTDEIDVWWRKGPHFRSGEGPMRFESGRLMEGVTQIGRVLTWEPGVLISFELWTWSLRPGEHSEVEVRFAAVGDGTRVTVSHRAWEPRATGAGEHRTVVGLWWGTLLPGLAARVTG